MVNEVYMLDYINWDNIIGKAIAGGIIGGIIALIMILRKKGK